MVTKVIHISEIKKYDNVVVIDRTSKWGNPFKVKEYGGDRKLVMQLFKDYFNNNEELKQMAVNELKDKTLACWCKPKECHGDVYVAFINADDLFG